jgi:hypothetical protein
MAEKMASLRAEMMAGRSADSKEDHWAGNWVASTDATWAEWKACLKAGRWAK